MSKMDGGCLCGKVRYSVTAEPVVTAVCHCKHCQKQSGTSFSVVVGVPSADLSITGALKTFQDRGESGKPVRRSFCPDCGSPITSVLDAVPGVSFIKAGTFDDATWLNPTMEVWCRSAQPWVKLSVKTKKFSKGPN